MTPELPPDFIRTIQNAFQGAGKSWLEAFPNLLEEASHRWDLTDIQPVPNLSYNFVAFALSGVSDSERNRSVAIPTRSSTTLRSAHLRLRRWRRQNEVTLKLGIPQKELKSEIDALRLYNGRGACRLLDADADRGMLLLERLQPGHMLASVMDDERATRIAADVMIRLWRPVPENKSDFIQLTDWFDGFKRLRQRFNGATEKLPKHLVEIAESLSADLLAENNEESLLHGDFHHFNVLKSARGWLAIDPKGVIGPKGYEVGPLLINPNDRFLNGDNPKVQTEKRIAILSEMLGMERERIRSWGLCHAVLSAWWSLEDKEDWRFAIRCAEIIQQA